MSTTTKNYQFIKPDLTDPADIRIINQNFDKLDDMIFQSGEVGEHLADPNAHSTIFAKYLPLSGGDLSGSLSTQFLTVQGNITMNGNNFIAPNNAVTTIGNGYGSAYGADIKFYGNGLNYNKNYIHLTASTNSTAYTRLQVSPTRVEVLTGAGNTTRVALTSPTMSTKTLYSTDNNSTFLSSLSGNCTMQFSDVSGNQFIRLNVLDNTIDITKDGVQYNGSDSVYVMERVGDSTNWYVKYSDGTLIQGGIIQDNNSTLTFPQPFKDTNYTFFDGAVTTRSATGGIKLGADNKTTTTIDLFHSYTNNSTNYDGWYLAGNDTNRVMAPHWMARGDWK